MRFFSSADGARRRGGVAYPAVLLLAAAITVNSANAAAGGDYTASQANAGRQIFQNHCTLCHGSDLQGKAGPALRGQAFASNMRYSNMTARELFDFIRHQMPKNAPGSLTDKQYLQVFSYILSRNGFPQGPKPLTDKSVRGVNLPAYLGKAGKAGSGTQSSSNH